MGDTTKIHDHDIRLAVIERDITENTSITKEILNLLKGDNGVGLCTKLACVEQSTKRLWWFIGAIALVISGTVIKLFLGM